MFSSPKTKCNRIGPNYFGFSNFPPNFVLSNSHPQNDYALSYNNYQPGRAKAITCFIEGTQSQPTAFFFSTTAHASQGGSIMQRTVQSTPFRMHKHTNDWIVIDRGKSIISFLPYEGGQFLFF